jgi:hypothetical protein
MRKITIVVASTVALVAATITTGALAQRAHVTGGRMGGARFGGAMGGGAHFGRGHFGGFGRHEFGSRRFGRRDFDRFAFRRRRFFGPGFGFVATGPYWWDDDWGDGCLSRWERTPSGWRQRLC